MKYNTLFYYLLLTSLCIFIGCSKPKEGNDKAIEQGKSLKEHSVLAVLWQQNAAEYRALCYQAYTIASQKINNLQKNKDKTYAIITDIDETVLDNSPYSGMQIKKDLPFKKEDWIEWGKNENANALPGALEFFKLADSLGIEVFYISNRYEAQLTETIKNLQKLGFPNADEAHVFLKKETSDKQERRDKVLKDHEVVLYMGDNLSDFSSLFDKQNTQKRNELVEELKSDFGRNFIIFPNPMYGDWETKGIYENNRNWSPEEMDSIRQAKVVSYK